MRGVPMLCTDREEEPPGRLDRDRLLRAARALMRHGREIGAKKRRFLLRLHSLTLTTRNLGIVIRAFLTKLVPGSCFHSLFRGLQLHQVL
jgi:hypothetical protein